MLKSHHLKTLHIPMDTAIAKLFEMSLSDDVRQQAALEMMDGKPMETALRHARAEIGRWNKPSGWSSFDDHQEGQQGLAELVAAEPETEFEQWRTADLDPATESMLAALAGGTAAIGCALGLTQRRVQQIVKKKIDQILIQPDLFGGAK